MIGGIGDNCTYTSAISKLKEPVCVMTEWPDIFNNHPNVAAIYKGSLFRPLAGNNESFYKSFDKIIICDSINSEKHLKTNSHLCEIAHDFLQVPYDKNETEYYFSDREKIKTEKFISKHNNLVLLQYQSSTHYPDHKIVKSIYTSQAQQMVNFLKDHFNFSVLEVSEKPNLSGTVNSDYSANPLIPYRDILCLLQYSKFFITIDSCLNHFSSNKFNKKKGIVFWGSTSMDKYSYDHNFNYLSEIPYAMYFNGFKIEKAILELVK